MMRVGREEVRRIGRPCAEVSKRNSGKRLGLTYDAASHLGMQSVGAVCAFQFLIAATQGEESARVSSSMEYTNTDVAALNVLLEAQSKSAVNDLFLIAFACRSERAPSVQLQAASEMLGGVAVEKCQVR
ncbi:hypothetical protein GUITHDRAFT_113362 [Guillardia theta CCMP2712]|uniref:Uncharacterized protein n=1 Tax=Guillardia theta (strain CCMP2712) TaxID=905079 RepID=L1IWG0_GUITC|nr:hypothetical protein GUITHDRAFT_113362 [Guillardia theta CCMP2712]EKX40576.1 hypothetical protein GUITHDRAFT_113362 [Guillardia theta CCMP2712]|eukprot:XP_005827556.1 hypothetical protein GUITHDRAFT_113362 [Guillardia theta CCMP2712]